MAEIYMAVATVFAIFWLILALRYQSAFDAALDRVNGKDFLLKSTFFIGLGFLKMIHYNINGRKASKAQKQLVALYGRKEGKFRYQIMLGAQVSYVLTFLPIVFTVEAMSGDPTILVMGLALIGIFVYYPFRDISQALKKRHEGLMTDLPGVESKLALLVCAGMPLRDAWKKTAYSAEGILYDEMQITIDEMQRGGFTEVEAYQNFAQRCNEKDIRKLTSMIVQNLEEGPGVLAYFLREMSDEAWEEKKNRAVQKGGIAANELLIPTILIFMGIVAIVVVPIFSGLGM